MTGVPHLAVAGLLLLALAVQTAVASESNGRNLASSADEGKVPRPGFDLHYRVVGAHGPYLVLLSGGPGFDIDYLQPVAEQLGRRYRCVLLEQRGTGRSKLKVYDEKTISFPAYLDDLEALREHLQQDRVILVGHSWGMLLALAYAGQYPNRTRAVITVGSGMIRLDQARAFHDNLRVRLSEDQQKALAENEKRLSSDFRQASTQRLRIVTPTYFFDRELGRKFAAEMRDDSHNPEVMRLAEPLIMTVEKYVYEKLPGITAPVLLIHGRQDICPEESALEAHQRIKNSELELIHRCCHFPWLEQPEEVWKTVNAFLATVDLAGDWIAVSAVINGKPLTEDRVKELKLAITNKSYKTRLGKQVLFEGIYKIDETSKPRHIDITAPEGEQAGKTSKGIYSLEGDTFKLCYTEPDKDRPKDFDSQPGSGATLVVWKRAK
jgi:proline iminopeptidase